jgi:hypothetical protein
MSLINSQNKQKLTRYADGPTRLANAVAGLDETNLNLSLTSSSWSIRQLVHHIVDGDDFWKLAIKAAIGNNGGTYNVNWYWEIEQDEWVAGWDYAGREIESSLALFTANRRHTMALLLNFPDAWENYVNVPWLDGEIRKVVVGSSVEGQGIHAIGHIEDILAIRKFHGI